ncbi:hypothetical protein LINPERPRIM_LOCUS5241 [Linum perenne]
MWMMGVWWTARFVTLRNKNQSPCEELFRYTCLSLQPRTLGLPWQLNFWLSWIVLPGGIQARSVSCSFVKEVANHDFSSRSLEARLPPVAFCPDDLWC